MSKYITLFSSDSRPRYEKDIFNIVALPINFKYRFRYRERYISKELLKLINSNAVSGTIALIAFRTNWDVKKENVFITPLRWATINEVRKIGSFYCFDFTVKQYVEYNRQFENAKDNLNEINQIAYEYFDTFEKNETFVVGNFPDIVQDYHEQKTFECNESWRNILETLFLYPKFKRRFFLRVSGLFDLDTMNKLGKESIQSDEYREIASVQEGGCTYLNIDYFNDEEDHEKSNINIEYDESLIIPIGDKNHIIESSYDSITYGFQAKKVLAKTQTQITINHIIKNEGREDDIRTQIKIPLVIRRNKKYILMRFFFTLFGVGLVGLPSVLPECTPDNYIIISYLIGTVVVSATWFVPFKE